jgi:hypothetical protein
VLRAVLKGLQDQHVESSLEKIAFGGIHRCSPRQSTRVSISHRAREASGAPAGPEQAEATVS